MRSVVTDVVRQLSVALSGLGEGWYLFGAQAALVYGSRRLTADIDVTLLPGTASLSEVIARLQRAGFSSATSIDHALPGGACGTRPQAEQPPIGGADQGSRSKRHFDIRQI